MTFNTYSEQTYDTARSLNGFSDIVILPTWIQTRVSTSHQVGKNIKGIFQEKASLEEQNKLCKDLISSYKGNCPKCSKEIRLSFAGESAGKGESGRNLDREDTQEIIKMAKLGAFKVMITTESDRIARKRSTAVIIRDQLKQFGVQVYAISQPLPLKCPNCFDPLDDDVGIITETISDMKSQLDLSRIRRNYKIGMPKRIEQGKPTGSLAYGLIKRYEIIGKDFNGNDHLKTTFTWDKEKAAIVSRIAGEYLAGTGTWHIAQKLNQEGIPSSHGKTWGRSAIIHILKNPIYSGLIRFGWKPVKNGVRKILPPEYWKVHKAEFKGIWSREYYDKIQSEIKRKALAGGRASSSDSLLVGVLKCGYCGNSMFQAKGGKKLKNGKDYVWRGYVCGKFVHNGICRYNGVKQDIVDRLVIKEILKLTNDNTRKAFYEKLSKVKKRGLSAEIKIKQVRLEKVKIQFQRVTEAFRKGVDSLEEYAHNKEQLLPQIGLLETEVSKLQLKIKQHLELDWKQQYELAMHRFLQYSDENEKRIVKTILNRILDRIELKKDPFYLKIFYKVDS